MNQAPGPKGAFLLGNLPEFQRDPMEMLKRLRRDYGDIVHFRLAHHHCYLFSHPDAVQYILRTNSRNFKKAFLFEKMRVLLGNGLLPMTYEDDFWRQRRRLSQPPFHRPNLGNYADTWGPATAAFLDHWQCYLDSGETFDFYAEMYALTFDLAVQTLLSTDSQTADTETVRSAFDISLEHIKHKIEGLLDLPEWIPTPRNRRFLEARRQIDGVVYRLIEQRRGAGEDAPKDFLTALIRACDDGEDTSDRQLRDEVVTMFIAGFETNASAIAWSIYCLMNHPQWEERVRQEVANVLAGRMPTLEDLPQLPLTRMVIDEAMRLYPPAWWIVRSPIAPDEVTGQKVSADSLVVVSQCVTHRHPDFWENPDDFDPMRFAPERSEERPALAFFPFGDGPRSCIGERFAYIQMQQVVAMLIQRFRFRAAAGHRVELMASATMRPRNGILVSIERS